MASVARHTKDIRKYRGFAVDTHTGEEHQFSRKDLELVERYDDDNVVIAEGLNAHHYRCDADAWDSSHRVTLP